MGVIGDRGAGLSVVIGCRSRTGIGFRSASARHGTLAV